MNWYKGPTLIKALDGLSNFVDMDKKEAEKQSGDAMLLQMGGMFGGQIGKRVLEDGSIYVKDAGKPDMDPLELYLL
jgi:hypothetical protein